MPWPVYANMRDIDLRAIYEYLKAIPHADSASADSARVALRSQHGSRAGHRGRLRVPVSARATCGGAPRCEDSRVPSQLTVLILGGYGAFGGRLARLLCDDPRVHLVIAGRSRAKADAFCAALPGKAARTAAVVDRNGDVARAIAALRPDIVVDASGPFQAYGDDPYALVRAALAARAHYLDLADGSEFVRNIVQLDAAAKAADRFVLSGASSFPVLHAAVLRRLARGVERVESSAVGIAPVPYAGVGATVMRAIAGYAGKPLRLIRDGRSSTAYALCETRRFTIAPPGRVPLAPLTYSLVDVPDLEALALVRPEIQSVWAGAAPTPAFLHWCLRLLAHGVRLHLVAVARTVGARDAPGRECNEAR